METPREVVVGEATSGDGPSMSSVSVVERGESSKSSIDLFVVPHTRMRDLVSWPLTEAAMATDVQDLEPSLQAVYEAMWELKTHEYIENNYIMNRLKARLQTKRVYNELVCNCHEDSKLLDVIHLVEKVYMAQTQTSRCKYGRQLQRAIKSFLSEFLQHMKEEEAVFGPLLKENFERKELEDMNETVLKQHTLFREKVRSEKTLVKAAKRKRSREAFDDLDLTFDDLRFRKSYCQEVKENKRKKEEDGICDSVENIAKIPEAKVATVDAVQAEDKISPIQLFPDEMLAMVFSHLSPRDLLSCSGVCRRWNRVAFSSVLWKALYPTQWTRGVWSFDYIPPRDTDIPQSSSSSLSSSTESLDQLKSDSSSSSEGKPVLAITTSTNEEKIFHGITKYLLPKIGSFVSTLIISASTGLNNGHIRNMLKQLPNVRHVDLSYTNVSAEAIIGLPKSGALKNLEELNLSGCRFVNDLFLDHLAKCYAHAKPKVSKSRLRKLSLSGCRSVTSVGIERLQVFKVSLQELDLSGCYTVDGMTLSSFVKGCSRLNPEKLSYCSEIEDGPYFDKANGCLNLDCNQRFCCRKLRNY